MREKISLMKNWMFTGPNGEKHPVDLPHTWNDVDGQDGGNDYFRGACVYEKDFTRPKTNRGQRVYLEFEGVNASAQVVVNGQKVMSHHNGYATFRADITHALAAENHLRVEVDNSVNDQVYPQKADFTFYGGIYREVNLLIVSENHFDLDYFGGPGMKITTDIQAGLGMVDVEAYVCTAPEEMGEVKTEFTLRDAEGNLIDTMIAESQGIICNAVFMVKEPHLWGGIKDPYLYKVEATLLMDGVAQDYLCDHCGIRTIQIDPKKGFFLNGQSYPLRGVSRHQDYKGIGNAISYEQMEQDMELIREVGANTIRLAHYQHNQYFYNLCDKYGMVVWAEISYISAHMPNGRENTFLQMRELIIQNYNHPSICVWGISNEITISHKHTKDMLDNHRELQKLCSKLDPLRPTTLACYAMCTPFHPVTRITDVVGWNLYLGWYVPGLFLNDVFMRLYHLVYPTRALGYSEYGAEGMPTLHSSHPRRGDHTEEYQAKYHEYMLKCFERHPFLWSTYVWNMFDFAADARNQGGEPGMNHKGLVTFDRKIKKDSFYIYKAWWSEEPFVHICGKRYEYRAEDTTVITIYSNEGEVSLYNNGTLVDTRRGAHVFRFQVTLEEVNALEAVAQESRDTAVIRKTSLPRQEYKLTKGKSDNWV